MKITYTTKEESNQLQQAEFLALTPVERFYRFLWLMEKSKWLTPKNKENNTKNFEIIINVK